MSDTSPTDLEVRPLREGLLSRISFVWIVPILALLISLGVAYQNYAQRGTLIEIRFENANGVAAGETDIKYRDVVVGRVERVRFDVGLQDVLIEARVDNEVAPYLDDSAQFWVVQPDVSLRGITGLQTVLSGVYIQGTWDDEPRVAQTTFIGREDAPINFDGAEGTEIILRAGDAESLSEGVPVLHKGIPVGYIGEPQISRNGETVTAIAFIEAPYDRLITDQTRFWATSALSISVGASGLSVDVSSLASLLEGGIAFDTVVSGGLPIIDGPTPTFDIFPDELAASESLFADPDQPTFDVAVLFDGTVAGLRKGSEVRFQGIRVGQVNDITAVVVEEDDQAVNVDLRAVLGIEPGRMGLPEGATDDQINAFFGSFVENGLRARLVTGNILSGALTVELLQVANADAATYDPDQVPYPLLPTTENDITDVADTADGVLQRINDLPIEELLQSGIDLMDSLDVLIRSEDIREAPEALVALLDEARALVASEDVQAIPGDVRGVIDNVGRIVLSADEQQLIAKLNAALQTANVALANVAAGTTNLEAISAETEALLAKINALEVQSLLTQTGDTLESIEILMRGEDMQALPGTLNELLAQGDATLAEARQILANEDMQALPAELRRVIVELNGIVADIAEADLVAQLQATIGSAQSAVASIDSAAEGLPAIVAEVEALAAMANDLELQALVDQTQGTLESIEVLMEQSSTQALPGSLAAALDEMRLLLADVNEGGAIANVNAALASANEAAQAIETAAEGLPALSTRATQLFASTQGVIAAYGERGRFNAETLQTLRDVQDAADAISQLARTIQRNPSSLLTGR